MKRSVTPMGEKPVMSRVVLGGGMNGRAESSPFEYLASYLKRD